MERLGNLTRRMYGERTFIRAGLALAMAKGAQSDAAEFARHMANGPWSDTPNISKTVREAHETAAQIGMVLKSVVPPTDLGSNWITDASVPFVEAIRRESVPGRLLSLGARRLPFASQAGNARLVGVGAAWRKSGEPIIVVETEFEGVALQALGIGGMIVATREFIELATEDASSSDTLDALLRGAVIQALDDVFASTDAAVADTSPAGVLRNVQTVSSSGATVAAIAADFNDAVQALTAAGISLRSVVAILSPEAATYLRMLKLTDASGDTIGGLPIIDTAPSGTVALIAAEYLGIAMADVVDLRASGDGTVQMSTAPDGTATNVVSLWQKNLRAIRATIFADFALVGPANSSGTKFAAVSITGAGWA